MARLQRRRSRRGRPNVPSPTLGGRQVWADEFVFAGWRIQRNYFTKHCRLLDAHDLRRAWGSLEECRAVFRQERNAKRLTLAGDHAVVLLHGMGRSRHCFGKLGNALHEDGFEVVAINYPSTRSRICVHARQVGRVLEGLDGVRSVSFVTHSMGGLVARELLALDANWRKRITPRRLVMLGPPNRGSVLADRFEKVLPFRLLAGAGGGDLVSRRVAAIPVPTIPFAVIAGGRGGTKGYNALIAGDNDGVVSVRTTRLRGMQDFLLVRALHTVLMTHPEAIAATRAFLRFGRFEPGSEG